MLIPLPSSKPGSNASQTVLPGTFSVGGTVSTRQDVDDCPIGSYCINGEKKLCAAGYYGNAVKLSVSTCTGPCDVGFVCSPGSTSPDDSTSTCNAGYFCPSKSSSTENECGSADYYCPSGVIAREKVKAGWYSAPLEVKATLRQREQACEPGYRCEAGVRSPCSNSSSVNGIDAYYCVGGVSFSVGVGNFSTGGGGGLRTGQAPCGPGYWCDKGERTVCAKGTYGATSGLTTVACTGNCTAGTYGDREGVQVDTCVGSCIAGYWCGPGSTSPSQNTCGSEAFFCGVGSSKPVAVQQKYYATPKLCTTTCTGSELAPGGSFAIGGLQFPCPALGNNAPFQVEELLPAGTSVTGLAWPISGAGGTSSMPAVTFALASASTDFELDSATGALKTTKPLSYNDKTTIDIIVDVTTTATYAGLGGAKYADACTVRIQVVDKNQKPVLSDASFDVTENVAKGTVVGTVTATDTDTNAFTYQIAKVVPDEWTDALKIDNANAGKIVVNDPTLIDYEALAAHDFRIVLQITVADNHPTNPETANATITVNVVDLDDMKLALDPETIITNKLSTEGGQELCFVGSGFSDVTQVDPGMSWVIVASYSDGNSGSYTAKQCETRGPTKTKICCKTVPGVGNSHTWSFQLTLSPSDILPKVSRMIKSLAATPTTTTSYAIPTISSLKGAVNMGTAGGKTVDVVGRNLGPEGTKGVATYASVSGDLSKKVVCASVLPTAGDAFVVMRCVSQPGFGGPLRWQIVVGGQTSEWTSFSNDGNPTSSYAGPQVTRVEPTSGPTVGGYTIIITGINFALRSSVSIGAYTAQIVRSNYTHIEAVVGGGMGQALQVRVRIGNLTSPRNEAAGNVFSYDAPAIQNVSVVSRGAACGSGVKHTDPTILHGCTQGSTILTLKGTNFGPGCEVSDEATSSDHACGCGIRLGGKTICTVPVETGSWCLPMMWGHSEIRCAVQPGAGGTLTVGVVAAGVHFAETNGPTFSYDAPVVHQITPSMLSADGGQQVSIIGDNFGPAGIDVTVSPSGYLICDHSNTSHKLVQCVTSTGRRGSGIPIQVEVETQQSIKSALANISYFPPMITRVQPSPGRATNPDRITIRGNNFGTSPVFVRVFLKGEAESCDDARWNPANPPKYPKSYIECQPRSGGASGDKDITLEFAKDDTFDSLLYGKGDLVFEDMYTVECSSGEYAIATGCEACPVDEIGNAVATCAGGSAVPVALPGYMKLGNANSSLTSGQVAGAAFKFTKCTPESACRGGGKCAVGYETPDNNCVGCVKKFYKLSGECKPCPESAGLLLAIYIAVVVVFGVFGLLLVKKGPSVAVTGVGIDYYQVLSIFVGFGIKWPAPVKDVLNVVSVSNMNIELVSPQCSIDFEYHQKWLVIELAPLGLGLFALFGYTVILLKKVVWHKAGFKGKKRAHGNLHRHANAIIGATILMFQFIYIYCTKTAFEIFACETKENGKSYMYFEPEIECWTGIHDNLWPLALFFVSLYGVGIPILFTVIVIRNRKIIKHDQVLRVLGTGSSRTENPLAYEFRKRFYKLYYRFKPRYHYWGEVILFRKFLIVIVTVFLKPNPTLQATCAVMILFVSYSMHIRTMPYLRNDLLGCENIEGLDQGDETGAEEDVPPGDRKERLEERVLEMVNLDPKALSLQQSAARLARKVSTLSGSFVRPTTTSTRAGTKSMGNVKSASGSLKRPKSMGNVLSTSKPSFGRLKRAQTQMGGNASLEASANVRVTIVEEEEKDGDGSRGDLTTTRRVSTSSPVFPASPTSSGYSSGVGGVGGVSRLGQTTMDLATFARTVTTQYGRNVPHNVNRPPRTKKGLAREKSRRLSALIHMGEGQSLAGEVGSSSFMWSRVRSHFIAGATAEAGAGGDAATTGILAVPSMHGDLADDAEVGEGGVEEGEEGEEEEDEEGGNTFSDKMKVSKNFLMDYNTMETVRFVSMCRVVRVVCSSELLCEYGVVVLCMYA